MIDFNKINYTHELNARKHKGWPIHPTEGRPRIGHLECLPYLFNIKGRKKPIYKLVFHA